ncbi:nucleotidyl transferase AbiEii/AbiGii toxin family protein [Haloplanus salilacus]|uniref:nucleotidyl transferase AbiEii/AbiGii toxin family protein n=1 Tax=Haloplanus salilacus TaxID=2949994 RepID=UPI0030CE52E1
MSDADRSQYSDEVTEFSENELQQLLEATSPPVSLLGGWAVHLHVTEAFEAENGREYIGSRDIDLGVHVEPEWDVETLQSKPVSTTLTAVESEMEYNRGRFGFYQYFHRMTKERLSDEEANDYRQHEIFRLDIDVLPSTEELDAFAEAFGFRPPADPLLKPVFGDGEFQVLNEFVEWEAPTEVRLAPREILAAMKVRAFPDRDKSHKRLKDLADLHALLWYGSDFNQLQSEVTAHLSQEDITQFTETVTDSGFANAAGLIEVDATVLQNSIQRLLA